MSEASSNLLKSGALASTPETTHPDAVPPESVHQFLLMAAHPGGEFRVSRLMWVVSMLQFRSARLRRKLG